MKTSSKIFAGIGGVALVIAATVVGQYLGRSGVESILDGRNSENVDAALMKAASDMNAGLPMMVDAETRLDSTIGIDRRFRYNYTLINYAADELDANAIRDSMTPSLNNTVCSTGDMKYFVDNEVPVTYAYYGKEGTEILTITVDTAKCVAKPDPE